MNTPNVLHLLVILFYGFMSTNSSSGASKIRQLNALLRSNFSPSIKPNDGEKSVRLEDKMWPQLKPDVVYYGPSIAAEGTQVSLSCRVLVYASVTWTINDRRVDDEDARITINEQIDKRVNRISSLRIVNASISDSGDYRCNTFSPLSHRLDIAPTRVSWASSNLDQSPRSSYVLKEGHRFTLPCEFEEEPEGQIRW
ncbi:hypothetical protein HDE_03264 [Halotydeus destructor]|nr:hypothetical protein HDE_03264 [Halotydeus destructor]